MSNYGQSFMDISADRFLKISVFLQSYVEGDLLDSCDR